MKQIWQFLNYFCQWVMNILDPLNHSLYFLPIFEHFHKLKNGLRRWSIISEISYISFFMALFLFQIQIFHIQKFKIQYLQCFFFFWPVSIAFLKIICKKNYHEKNSMVEKIQKTKPQMIQSYRWGTNNSRKALFSGSSLSTCYSISSPDTTKATRTGIFLLFFITICHFINHLYISL